MATRGWVGVRIAAAMGVCAAGLASHVVACSSSSSQTKTGLNGPDAMADVTVDAPTDAPTDGLAPDDGGDGGESQDADAGPSPPGLVFARSEALAICTQLLGCCPGGDAGIYDVTACVAENVPYGWEGTLPSDPAVYSRPYATLDASAGAGCLAAIATLPCGHQTAAQWSAVTQACLLVVQGTLAVGASGCTSSFECAPGAYCSAAADGGVCAPLAEAGARCDTAIQSGVNPIPDQMCSYLGSGEPPLFCDLVNFGADAATCKPLLEAGAPCSNIAGTYYDDQACPTGAALCGDDNVCGATAAYPYPGFCAKYAKAGGGG